MTETKPSGYKSRFLEFYQKHEVVVSVGVFTLGFVFDLLTLGRIDDLLNLVQQAVYLVLLGGLIILEIKVKIGQMQLSPRMKNFWQYHDLVVHFLFGSLLSAYTIFYYTSASALTSFFFIVLLAGLMLANEVPRIQKLGLPVRVILYTICMLSYFSFFYPILMGHVGFVPFWLGLISSLLVLGFVWKINFKDKDTSGLLKKHVLYPGIAVHIFFVVGYYTSLIPPVPVAVKKIGIYYDVVKSEGNYLGKHQKTSWKFWHKGSQEFLARPDDKVYVLLSIFSPAHFEDKIFLKWYIDDPVNGWVLEDSIPLTITGGRDEGFRGFASKQFYRVGNWRIEVETSDGREVGRISLKIKEDHSKEDRVFETDSF